MGPTTTKRRRARFRAVFDANATALLAFALRRVDRPEDAADVVAEMLTDIPVQPSVDVADLRDARGVSASRFT